MDILQLNKLAHITLLAVAMVAITRNARKRQAACVSCSGCVENPSPKTLLFNHMLLLGIVLAGIIFISWGMS